MQVHHFERRRRVWQLFDGGRDGGRVGARGCRRHALTGGVGRRGSLAVSGFGRLQRGAASAAASAAVASATAWLAAAATEAGSRHAGAGAGKSGGGDGAEASPAACSWPDRGGILAVLPFRHELDLFHHHPLFTHTRTCTRRSPPQTHTHPRLHHDAASAHAPARGAAARRAAPRAPLAEPDDAPPPAPPALDAESRLEALERGARRGRGTETAAAAAKRAAAASSAAATDAPPGTAEWREGPLLPDGFDEMPLPRKIGELYAGRRGLPFWLNQAAWYFAIGVGVGWVLFRFILPGFRLYKLANGLTDAPPPL